MNWKHFWGRLLVVGGFGIGIAGEMNNIQTHDKVADANADMVDVADCSTLDASLDGRLVHMTGMLSVREPLCDPLFGVAAHAAILDRHYSIYQWGEDSEEIGDKDSKHHRYSYSYSRAWYAEPVNSSYFNRTRGHENTCYFQCQDSLLYAAEVYLGAYRINKEMLEDIQPTDTVTLIQSPEAQRKINVITTSKFPNDRHSEVEGNRIVMQSYANATSIGDVRITYKGLNEQIMTAMARVEGDRLVPYTSEGGGEFNSLERGRTEMSEALEKISENSMYLKWMARVFAFFLFYFGLKNLFDVISQKKWLRSILADFISHGSFLVVIALSFIIVFTMAGLSELCTNPPVGGALVAVAILFFLFMRRKGKHNTRQDFHNSSVDEIDL